MPGQLQPGVSGTVGRTVEEQHTATHVGSGQAAVLATPVMIAFMETAAMEAVQPFLPEGHTTVGVHVDVRHLAPTPMGMKVTARAELTKIEGRLLTFRVTVDDEKERVGEGAHQRAIIDVARFQERVRAKAASAR